MSIAKSKMYDEIFQIVKKVKLYFIIIVERINDDVNEYIDV